jgi:hypothetical protein
MAIIHPIDIESFIEFFHPIDFNLADGTFTIMNSGDFWHRSRCCRLV